MNDRRREPGYGTPNWDMIGRWFEMPPEDDTEFWAVNLMRYRTVATYADGRDTTVSGKDADDAYAPLGPLEAVGALPAFLAEVAEQRHGSPQWHRIGIVRYPSRAAFFAMQQRDDFKEQHVHKEAGMETTIVAACHPTAVGAAAGAAGTLVLTVERTADGAPAWTDLAGVAVVVDLLVEGVIVGDERTWTRMTFSRAADAAALAALAAAVAGADDGFVMALDEPSTDRLVESVTTAPNLDLTRPRTTRS